jgi:hypothetical protein
MASTVARDTHNHDASAVVKKAPIAMRAIATARCRITCIIATLVALQYCNTVLMLYIASVT